MLVKVNIFTTSVEYNKLMEESMQIWTSLQVDPNVQKIAGGYVAKATVVRGISSSYKDISYIMEAPKDKRSEGDVEHEQRVEREEKTLIDRTHLR